MSREGCAAKPPGYSLKSTLERWVHAEADRQVPPLHPAWAGLENDFFKDRMFQMLALLRPVVEAAEELSQSVSSRTRFNLDVALAELREKLGEK